MKKPSVVPRVVHLNKADALYIPSRELPDAIKQTIKDRYTVRFYNEKACAKCEHVAYRHSEEFCTPCAAFTDEVRLSGEYSIRGKRYVKVPLGDRMAITSYLNNKGFRVKLYDRTKPAKKYPFKFIGTLREYQVGVPEILERAKRGVLQAPARSGKTTMACATICYIGEKALILAAQKEWLDGFYDTFMGSETTPRMSNVPKHMIGYCKNVSDFEKYAVCLATYQTFINARGQKVLQKILSMFGVIVIDEVHGTPAHHFLKIVSAFNCKYMFGLTATPDRKDGMYKLTDMVIGRVVHKVKREVLRCKWVPTRTKFKDSRSTGLWVNLVKRLEKNPARLKFIAEWAIKDMANGHTVLIPFSQVTPVKALTEAINKLAGEKVAYAFTGSMRKVDRKRLVADAQKGLIKCIVGTNKLLSVGTNIPPASCWYDTTLNSNLPNAEQRYSRILTPHEGKPQPIVRYFIDDYKIRRSCARAEWFGKIKKHFNPILTPKDEEVWLAWLAGKDSSTDFGRRKMPLLGW